MRRADLFFAPAALLFGVLPAVTGCLQLGLGSSGSSGSSSGTGGTSSSSPSTGSGGTTPETEEGSCNAWKVAYCDAIEECSAFQTRKECETDVGYVRCLKDADTAGCETAIRAALKKKACDKLPNECEPKVLADRTEPTRACKEIYQAICERSLYCGTELSVESCLSSLEASSPCKGFTAVLPSADTCIDELAVAACGDATPESCTGVLRY